MRLQDKVVIISGGARGMGATEARLFAKHGAMVVIGDVLEEEGRAVAEEINASGGNCRFTPLDVTDESQWARATTLAVDEFGKLNGLVNNAGIGGTPWLGDNSRRAWDAIMDVNSTGVYLGAMSALPAMKAAGGGSIVNISSQLGIVGADTGHPAYQASKGSVRIFSKSIAIQYAKDNIRCNSVHPGPIETPMTANMRLDSEFGQKMLSKIPMGRVGQPMEVAWGVLYLLSDESSYVTGSELVIDGGWVAQ